MKIVFLGLSISSTYRGLVRDLARLGHQVWFLERDVPWYASNRDADRPAGAELLLYDSLAALKRRFQRLIAQADATVIGSFVPEGTAVCDWVLRVARGATAFYDIDTPVTLARLAEHSEDYLAVRQVSEFDLYLSFTGGPLLRELERAYGARRAVHLPCSADPERYRPLPNAPLHWTMGYLGTYSLDRLPALDRLLLQLARKNPRERFVVAGPQYPASLEWPRNVDRIEHLAPEEHAAFYCSQRYTLNLTRRSVVAAGWSPSGRLFEAAACGVPIVTDPWPGLGDYFEPVREIIVAGDTPQLAFIPEEQRTEIGARGRARVLAQHTSRHRAEQLARLLSAA